MDPRGTAGKIYKEDHYSLLQTKYDSSGPCGLGEEDFLYVLPLTPQGHSWQDLYKGPLYIATHKI